MRVLVCPQEFKGSLTAHEAANAIAEGVRRAIPSADVAEAPMADGGPGTVAIIAAARHGELVPTTVQGPLGDPVEAVFALIRSGPRGAPEAVIEAAQAAGLTLVPPSLRNPARASSRGVGEQIVAAMHHGARLITIGAGGSATNDGGAGIAEALGYRLLDGRGRALPPGPGHLPWLARIDAALVDPLLREVEVRVAADVTNPLLGPLGATAVFSAQKGAGPALRPRLEAALARWAAILRRDLGVDVATLEGGGAGGGIAAGLAALAGARIESGAALVADAIGLARQVDQADVVVTGEGRLDAQTQYGKAVFHVARLAGEYDRPCLVVAGTIEAKPETILDAEAASEGVALEEAVARARELVAEAAERLLRRHAGLDHRAGGRR
jgi:glycerate kinase